MQGRLQVDHWGGGRGGGEGEGGRGERGRGERGRMSANKWGRENGESAVDQVNFFLNTTKI